MDEEKRRGRPPRSEVEQQRRRRRKAHGGVKNLGVDESLLDHDKFAYRWINDADVRMIQKTKYDDWNVMTQNGGELKEDATDFGNAVSKYTGVKKDGSPQVSYLCRKPRQWYEEDQTEKQTELDEQLARLRVGQSAKGESQGDYIPNAGIKIAR